MRVAPIQLGASSSLMPSPRHQFKPHSSVEYDARTMTLEMKRDFFNFHHREKENSRDGIAWPAPPVNGIHKEALLQKIF